MTKDSTQNLLILVDGSSYLHRAYHALPPLTNSAGMPTGAIYGVMKMLRRLVNDYHPKYMAVVFDAKGKTFRHDLYKEYKANRPPMDDDLKVQIAPLHELIHAMKIPLLMVEGVEADDVIGTLAKQAETNGLKTIISASDKDLAQLVNKNITLIDTMSNTTLDIAGVTKKWGVPPELMVDYLTLIGDTSDNIPGVSGVGPKTAVKWLAEYGSLENIIKNADKIPGKVGEKLRDAIPSLPLSKDLVTIRCDLKLPMTPKELIDQPDDTKTLHELFEKLEFKSWLQELDQGEPKKEMTHETKAHTKQHYEIIQDEKSLSEWISKIEKAELFSLDTETTSLNYMEAELVGVSFALDKYKAAYIPLAHKNTDQKQLSLTSVLKTLKPLLENPKIKKVGQNIKYDKQVLSNYDIDLQGIEFDTMLESYVLDSNAEHNLNSLAIKYLDYHMTTYEMLTGKGAKQIPFAEIAINDAAHYSAEDADITLQIHEKLWPKIAHEKGPKKILQEIEMPLIPVLARMERQGVLIDQEALTQQSHTVEKEILELEKNIFKEAGGAFNIDSPKQLQEILYDKLSLPVLKKTPTGQPSTAEESLQELALEYPLPKLILEYRTLSKIKSTYLDALPNAINPKTKRIHTSFHQAITSTGRLSSSDPNLQNIPIRTEAGKKIREAFIAPHGYSLIAADYSQIELRIMAHLSKDTGLLKAFEAGEDIHRATAAQVFGVELSQVSADQRRKAKAINFGLLYGMSPYGLAKQLGVEPAAAKAYIEAYFEKYPKVRKYMDETRALARKQGYVETLFGRRLYVPAIHASNKMVQKAAERAAINAPLQGTAADIIKLAMIHLDEWLQKEKMDARLILQVHDELVFEVHDSAIEKVKKQVEKIMTHSDIMPLPLCVEIGIGKNWNEAH